MDIMELFESEYDEINRVKKQPSWLEVSPETTGL